MHAVACLCVGMYVHLQGEGGCPFVLDQFCMSMSKYQVSQKVRNCFHACVSEALTHMLDSGCVRLCVCRRERVCVVSRPFSGSYVC